MIIPCKSKCFILECILTKRKLRLSFYDIFVPIKKENTGKYIKCSHVKQQYTLLAGCNVPQMNENQNR